MAKYGLFLTKQLNKQYKGIEHNRTILIIDKELNRKYATHRSWIIVLLGLEVIFTSLISTVNNSFSMTVVALLMVVINEALLWCFVNLQYAVENRNFLLVAGVQQVSEDKREEYIESVTEYRNRINAVITSGILILTMLTIYYIILPTGLGELVNKKLSVVLGVVTFSSIGSALFFILQTENKLEKIYWYFFPTEYEKTIKEQIGL
ncbi:hypothetical protein [Leuconostoc lactis]|uniref:hypothetical protein n=1 Tax=Leuconostoc lactis TaxID=1246 RepID=UPI00189B4757|nr:hypothetical protein [Leuconostoc lactis]